LGKHTASLRQILLRLLDGARDRMAYINRYVNRKVREKLERNVAERREGLKTRPYEETATAAAWGTWEAGDLAGR
jgi:hypothetical protein